MVDAGTAPWKGTVPPSINTYGRYYRDVHWTECHVNPAYVICKFVVSEDGTMKQDEPTAA
jgi:hypothetical protein